MKAETNQPLTPLEQSYALQVERRKTTHSAIEMPLWPFRKYVKKIAKISG
jgi:hypothetical protein